MIEKALESLVSKFFGLSTILLIEKFSAKLPLIF